MCYTYGECSAAVNDDCYSLVSSCKEWSKNEFPLLASNGKERELFLTGIRFPCKNVVITSVRWRHSSVLFFVEAQSEMKIRSKQHQIKQLIPTSQVYCVHCFYERAMKISWHMIVHSSNHGHESSRWSCESHWEERDVPQWHWRDFWWVVA